MSTATTWPTVATRVHPDLRAKLEAKVPEGGRLGPDVLVPALEAWVAEREQPNPLTATHPGSARAGGPATSKAAAADVAPRIGSQRERALRFIAQAGPHGATADEVLIRLEQVARAQGSRPPAPAGLSRRVSDLLEVGAVEQATTLVATGGNGPAPVERVTRHGAMATVYVVTAKGRRWLEDVDRNE